MKTEAFARLWIIEARSKIPTLVDGWGVVLYPEYTRKAAEREAREYRQRTPGFRTRVVAFERVKRDAEGGKS